MGSGSIVFIALSFLLAVLARPVAADETTVDLELVIAVDVSFSMDQREQLIQRNGYVDALQDPLVMAAILGGPLGRIAVTYVEWGGTAVQTVPWTVIDSPGSATRFAWTLSQQPMWRISFTSISDTIAFARHLIGVNAFHAKRRVIDMSGDGPNNYGAPAPIARDAALREGITIDGLPIMLDRPSSAPTIPDIDAYYQHCVIGGSGSFLMRVRTLDDFDEAIRNKLVTEITGPRLTELPRNRLRRVQYSKEPRYNCLIGEELQEHPRRSD
ncbi:DUF1194 domain-containing protein [Nordella sp. HKS 07]|uniref:DUF1194 domain-containing protein n=1 Tax=Nordella sp. HKS 07 TaxID=2712222 RepID=UPI0013E18812|nr:DUF1194 domain-containing protein [Nordella sp. HKS 07]QIG49380.1 DUF1194 domain-containing protein [Nordella sp. HKS 07]